MKTFTLEYTGIKFHKNPFKNWYTPYLILFWVCIGCGVVTLITEGIFSWWLLLLTLSYYFYHYVDTVTNPERHFIISQETVMIVTPKINVAEYHLVKQRAVEMQDQFPTLRRGQARFNALYELYPTVAEAVRGTTADPFYDDGKIPVFEERILLI